MNGPTRRSSLPAIERSCRFRRARRDQEGATLVEFAIILPVFALMLFGMIQFGLGFAGWDELRNAVQTSTRVAANNPTNSSPNCGQTDPGSNLVCQVALSIGAPVDTAPTPLNTLTIPQNPLGIPEFSCTSPLESCTGPAGGYAWLDGYYIFENGQWLQIINRNNASAGQITDTEAFDAGVGTWSCSLLSGSNCSSVATNVAGQNANALASDNIAINVDTMPNQLQVCAQRQLVSFTAIPGLQGLHISTSSSFYIPLTGTSTTVLSCPDQPSGPPCTYQSAGGITCG